MIKHARLVPVVAALLLAVPLSLASRAVSPNAVMEWNQIALGEPQSRPPRARCRRRAA